MLNNIKTNNNKSGIGVGSASIVLIFSVLCLTVFTLITYIVANNNKSLVDAELELVTGYYEANALAERVLLELTTAAQGEAIETASGNLLSVDTVDVFYEYDEDLGTNRAYFYCPINEVKSLYVSVVMEQGLCIVHSWRMVDTGDWQTDDSVNIWDGE